jgi:hypothetical protein
MAMIELTEREALVLSQITRFVTLPVGERLKMVEELTGSARRIGEAILDVPFVALSEEEKVLANSILKWQSPEVRRGRIIK